MSSNNENNYYQQNQERVVSTGYNNESSKTLELLRVKSAAMLNNQELPPIQMNEYAVQKQKMDDSSPIQSKRIRNYSKQSQPKQHKVEKSKYIEQFTDMQSHQTVSDQKAQQLSLLQNPHRKNQSVSLDLTKHGNNHNIKDYLHHNAPSTDDDPSSYNFLKENAIQHASKNNTFQRKPQYQEQQSKEYFQESDSQIQKSLQEIQSFSVYLESFKKNLEYLALKEKQISQRNQDMLNSSSSKQRAPNNSQKEGDHLLQSSQSSTKDKKIQLENRDLAHYYYLPNIKKQSITQQVSKEQLAPPQTLKSQFLQQSFISSKELQPPIQPEILQRHKITMKVNSKSIERSNPYSISPDQENLRAFLQRQVNINDSSSSQNESTKSRNGIRFAYPLNQSQEQDQQNKSAKRISQNQVKDPEILIKRLALRQKLDVKNQTLAQKKEKDSSISKNKSYFEIFRQKLHDGRAESDFIKGRHIKKVSLNSKKGIGNGYNLNLNNDISNIL